MRIAGIYAIRHCASRKVYVGSSGDCVTRLKDHRARLNRGVHWLPHLQNAWRKYGAAAFEFAIVERVDDLNFLLPREQFWIWRTNACDRASGYNVLERPDRPPVGMNRGMKHSPETLAKLSAMRRGKKRSAETRRNISDALKRAYAEGKFAGRRRAVWSQETRNVIGRKQAASWTPERRAAQAERMRRVQLTAHSPEVRRKAAASLLGRPLSQAHRAKIAETVRQQWTPARRAAQSAWWARRKAGAVAA